MLYILDLIIMMTLVSLLNVLMHSTQLLMTLLSLELVTLCMVILMPMILIKGMVISPSIMILLLTMGACEASLGLTLMVIMSRKFGSDNLKLMSISKC
uniref:NADH dehydrogenase subunit 4L n=1 Tax=Calliobdella nodulifera TaxID=3385569 RepID=UPI00207AD7C4|nr:NADH dehydrogenase subunit 4L [Notostomum cyclostomum]URP31060.1 NADH dehydrogenase subunit 4L [Notostomum cyclostomum]